MSPPALLEFLLRGAFLLALVWGLQLLLRRRSAGLRHATWGSALAALLALPLVSLFLPAIEVEVPAFVPMEPARSRAAPLAEPNPPDSTAERPVPAPATVAWDELLLGLWLAGAGALVAQHLVRRLTLARIARRGTALCSQAWCERARLASAAVGLRREVRLVVSPDVPVPLALGLGKPAILLPERALAWDEAQLASVLRHELVHLRRRDELSSALAVLARALHWPDPLAWLGCARFEHERERSCDDGVLLSGVPASTYAAHLLAVASEVTERREPALSCAPALARSPELAERVRALLDASLPRAALRARSAVLILLVAVGAALPLGARYARALGMEALERVRAIVALRERPSLNANALALLLAALGDDRHVDPRAVPLASPGPLQGGLFETTPGKEAARVLARHGGAAREALLTSLGDADAPEREKAAWALGCAGAREAAPALARLLARDPSAAVRRIAAWALGEMGARSERLALEVALSDRAPEVRAQAAHSLGDLRDARSVPVLIEALRDPEASVRTRAAHGLGDIAHRSALPALRQAHADSDPGVRGMVGWALRECGEEER